jgi:elongator complex protein 3
MIRMQVEIPYYCRVSRLIRDFPATEISGGNKVSNLRDVIEQRMKRRGLICKCLRCREAGHRPELSSREKILLFRDEYANVGGKEFFLSWEDAARTTCLSFLRLRLPGQDLSLDEKTKKQQELLKNAFPELEKSAFVRELHTYGQALAVDEKSGEAIQHKGLGRALLKEAERIVKEAGFQYLSVISGIGVRGYYRRLGYRLVGTYMRKRI